MTMAVILMILFFVTYLLPGIVAELRKHSMKTSITIINMFLGWTLVGWVVALAWAFSEDNR